MQSPPADISADRLREELADGWGIRARSIAYLPEGGGSHHFVVAPETGLRRFVTVDDLDDKEWLGDTRESVLGNLRRAFGSAEVLHKAGLDFVVPPMAANDGEMARRLGERYCLSVFPFLDGRSYPFGPYADAHLRDVALDMLAELHGSTAAIRSCAPSHEPGYTGRHELAAFLGDPRPRWDVGPFSEPARRLLAGHVSELAELVGGFDHLVDRTAAARANTVMTHGEPHPANLMSVGGRIVLVDWDTAGLGPPERDVALVAAGSGEGISATSGPPAAGSISR